MEELHIAKPENVVNLRYPAGVTDEDELDDWLMGRYFPHATEDQKGRIREVMDKMDLDVAEVYYLVLILSGAF